MIPVIIALVVVLGNAIAFGYFVGMVSEGKGYAWPSVIATAIGFLAGSLSLTIII